tara:strand:+ start:216 stop:386 length:171 start_codon:yes stop_codon:yes gene_type:complete
MSDYDKIIKVLEEVADVGINLGSKVGREFLARKIKDSLDNVDRKIQDWEEVCFPSK